MYRAGIGVHVVCILSLPSLPTLCMPLVLYVRVRLYARTRTSLVLCYDGFLRSTRTISASLSLKVPSSSNTQGA